MDFFRYKNKLAPDKGLLLLSEPFLPDPNFERTVILLTEKNDEGTVGFVLNKPSETRVADVMEDLKIDLPIFIGGPVQQDTLHFIHRNVELKDAIEVADGLYWGGDFEHLVSMIDVGQISVTDIKFFLGYSGWSPGQLEEELQTDSWIVSNQYDEQLIFETLPDQMWKNALRNLGGRFSVYSNYPADPRLN